MSNAKNKEDNLVELSEVAELPKSVEQPSELEEVFTMDRQCFDLIQPLSDIVLKARGIDGLEAINYLLSHIQKQD